LPPNWGFGSLKGVGLVSRKETVTSLEPTTGTLLVNEVVEQLDVRMLTQEIPKVYGGARQRVGVVQAVFVQRRSAGYTALLQEMATSRRSTALAVYFSRAVGLADALGRLWLVKSALAGIADAAPLVVAVVVCSGRCVSLTCSDKSAAGAADDVGGAQSGRNQE
jgi:hypothetical protein